MAKPTPSQSYPSIADYGLIGDCTTAALISREGSIDWCCLPRFDSGSAFGRLLDWRRGGYCSVSPARARGWKTAREYLNNTLVLATTYQSAGGQVKLTDALLLGDPRAKVVPRDPRRGPEILRVIEGERGMMDMEVTVAPRFDYGAVRPWVRQHGPELHSMIGGNDGLVVWCEHQLEEKNDHELAGRFQLQAGETIHLLLAYRSPEELEPDGPQIPGVDELDRRLRATIRWWRSWTKRLDLGDDDQVALRRSAITLKALTHAPTGAIAAAPTTSLPEVVGKSRNWDYRYAWVRDSSFSSRAFAEVGCEAEADAFRSFIVRSAAGHAEELQVVFGVGGERRLRAWTVDELEGYRCSKPVRVGNGASSQRQLDAYGEIVNLSFRWHRRGHSPSDDEWRFLVSVIEHAADRWSDPDSGIWEWPGEPQHFVHSKASCWSALNRGIQMAEECMRRAPIRRWTKVRDQIQRTIERRGYDRKRGIFVQTFDRPELDAALLLLPTLEFVAWDDERMVRTVDAVREELGAGDGLVYRYRRRDGLAGREGAFLCCSFWLVDCLARSGHLHDAHDLYEKALTRANDLGLFSEEFDPRTGEPVGNFPQGLTHLAHIDAATALAEARAAV
jgi:GH15 family glucan-1,4-alpha-glucosidase